MADNPPQNTHFDFEVLIDDYFININSNSTLSPIDKKKVLSIVNDFEDGNWRYSKFQSFIWDNIVDTALSYKDRMALLDRSQTSLVEAAKKLRLTDINKDQVGQGSELAEIVLYGIMKHHYKALPAVPKIFYKQNAKDNAKGADSVHIVVEDDDKFSIWFGEAKFYNSIDDDRLSTIIESVQNSLQTDKLKKENSIITSVSDLKLCLTDNASLHERIISLLDTNNSIDNIKPILHIPILLLHECSITAGTQELTDKYRKDIIEYHKNRAEIYFEKQIQKVEKTIFKYSEIHFHLILFPVPKKEPIIDAFVENVQHYRKQGN